MFFATWHGLCFKKVTDCGDDDMPTIQARFDSLINEGA
jgi:hypothetical protein